jgi:hypothetical protein
MKPGFEIFASRFARRLFTVFIASAILPVLTLAVLSFNRVPDQLLVQNEQQQRQEVKAIGMAIYERLTLLESELQLITSRRMNDTADLLDSISASTQLRLSEKFENIGWLDQQAVYTPLLHFGRQFNALNVLTQAADVASGFTILTAPNVSGERHIFMLQSGAETSNSNGSLIAELDTEYLWNQETIAANQGLCMLDHLDTVLFCSPTTPEQLIASTDPEDTAAFAGNFEWLDPNRNSYLVSYWSIFLRGEYGIDDWTVLTTIPRQDIVSPITDFQTTFILIFVISLLVVLMLSSSQIQRILIPLQKLKLGIRAVGDSHSTTR